MPDKDLPYEPGDIEHQVQEYWKENESLSVTEDHTAKREALSASACFPIPSGPILLWAMSEPAPLAYATRRFQKDAWEKCHFNQWVGTHFGLPAESAATDDQVQPSIGTSENIESMEKQLTRLGFAYDWRARMCNIRIRLTINGNIIGSSLQMLEK